MNPSSGPPLYPAGGTLFFRTGCPELFFFFPKGDEGLPAPLYKLSPQAFPLPRLSGIPLRPSSFLILAFIATRPVPFRPPLFSLKISQTFSSLLFLSERCKGMFSIPSWFSSPLFSISFFFFSSSLPVEETPTFIFKIILPLFPSITWTLCPESFRSLPLPSVSI